MSYFNNKKQLAITVSVFSLYLIFLVWLVLFKLTTDFQNIPHIVSGVNIIPFVNGFSDKTILKETAYNFLVFIPFGVYLAAFAGPLISTFAAALLSVSFEMIEYNFSIGICDITDVFTNTLGAVFGVFIFYVLGKIFAKRRMNVINSVNIIFGSVFIVLFSFLTVVNI